MLYWTLVYLVVALIAGLFGFGGIASASAGIAKLLYAMAAQALSRADQTWLSRMISRRVPLTLWREALEHRPGDIKVVVDFTL